MSWSKLGLHPEENNSGRIDPKSVSKGTASVRLGVTRVWNLTAKPLESCSPPTQEASTRSCGCYFMVGGGGNQAFKEERYSTLFSWQIAVGHKGEKYTMLST